MKKTKETIGISVEAFESGIDTFDKASYVLRLYVTGLTVKSVRSISNLKKICEEHLNGQYDLEVIDLFQRPELLQGEQIIAAPTLIKKLPLPLRRIIGDMSDTERVLIGLDLKRIKKT